MQKVRHDKTHQRTPASWLSTARSVTHSARSSEPLVSPINDESAEPRDRLVENFQKTAQQFVSANDQHEPLARPDLSTGPKNTACNSNSTQAHSPTGIDRVVFFLHRDLSPRRNCLRRTPDEPWLSGIAASAAGGIDGCAIMPES